MASPRSWKQLVDEAMNWAERDLTDQKFRDLISVSMNWALKDLFRRGPFNWQFISKDITLINDGRTDYLAPFDYLWIDSIHVIANDTWNPVIRKDIKEFKRIVRDASTTKQSLPIYYFEIGIDSTENTGQADPNLRKNLRFWPPVIGSGLKATVDGYLEARTFTESVENAIPAVPSNAIDYIVFRGLAEAFLFDEDPRAAMFAAKAQMELDSITTAMDNMPDTVDRLQETDMGSPFGDSYPRMSTIKLPLGS